MARPEKRTISLPPELAIYIDNLVASGTYASVSEVVRAGIRALRERDAAVDRWMRDTVAGTYDAMRAAPGSELSAEDVQAELHARNRVRRGKARRGI